MDRLPDEIELTRVADRAQVSANLVRLTRSLAQQRIDSKWWELSGVPKQQRQAENDYHWRWAKRLGELKNERWYEATAVQTDDGNIQGAIIYWINGASFLQGDQGSVTIEALATAPRNREWLVSSPLYRAVGGQLLLRAAAHSYLLGLAGRVNLTAFDDARLVSYYLNRGFEAAGYEDELPRFELSPDRAMAWLREKGYEL